jgi:hypothetical protein
VICEVWRVKKLLRGNIWQLWYSFLPLWEAREAKGVFGTQVQVLKGISSRGGKFLGTKR